MYADAPAGFLRSEVARFRTGGSDGAGDRGHFVNLPFRPCWKEKHVMNVRELKCSMTSTYCTGQLGRGLCQGCTRWKPRQIGLRGRSVCSLIFRPWPRPVGAVTLGASRRPEIPSQSDSQPAPTAAPGDAADGLPSQHLDAPRRRGIGGAGAFKHMRGRESTSKRASDVANNGVRCLI